MFLKKNSKRLSMLNKSIEILGVRIDIFTIEEINNLIIYKASEKFNKSTVIFKPYVEFLSLASKNSDIKKLLNSSDINIADSVAIQWSASYLYGAPKIHPNLLSAYYSLLFRMKSKKWRTQIVPERMAGLDQTLPLLKLANSKNLKIGIIGGPIDIESTKKEITKRFKNLNVHIWSGYFSESKEQFHTQLSALLEEPRRKSSVDWMVKDTDYVEVLLDFLKSDYSNRFDPINKL